MKLAITATGSSLDSPVDGRFGRCGYFVLLDPDTNESEAVENRFADAAGGVGVQAAQLMIDSKVDAVLTGNCGPRAFSTLDAAGIKVYIGASGLVEEAVKAFKDGKLNPADGPSSAEHSGLRG